MQETDPDLADLDDIVARVGHEMIAPDPGRRLDPLDLSHVGVDRDLGQLQQLGDAHDGMAEQVAADVIGVIVGGEHTGEAHVIGLEESDYFPGA